MYKTVTCSLLIAVAFLIVVPPAGFKARGEDPPLNNRLPGAKFYREGDTLYL